MGKRKKEKQKESKIQAYPSAQIIKDATILEYEFEAKRKQGIESRTGILLAFSGTLFVYILTNNVLKLRAEGLSWNQFLLLISVGALSYSIYLQIRVLNSREYKRINCTNFNDEFAANREDSVAVSLFKAYINATIVNQKQNDDKIKFFNKSLYFLMVALVLIAIYPMFK